jgi:peroxiredoxin
MTNIPTPLKSSVSSSSFGRPAGAQRRASRVAGIALSALIVAGIGIALRSRGPALPVAAAIGARAPEFKLEVLGKPGEHLALSDLRGRPAIVIFNCGCRLCYDFNNAFKEVAPRMKDAQPVGIMMNHYSYAPGQVRNFRETTGFQGPLLMDNKSATTLTYNSTDCPRAWLIDRDGVIRYVNKDNKVPADVIARELLEAYRKL